MLSKWGKVWGILAVALLIAPLGSIAQEAYRVDRGNVQVTNDWEQPVRVTLWKERGGQMSRQTWTVPRGQSVVLMGERGRQLWAGGSDLIKVGEEWGRVPIGTVGHFQGGVWFVSVRNIWRATHQERGRFPGQPGLPPDQPGTPVPPPYRR
jgi:hypothetical protein